MHSMVADQNINKIIDKFIKLYSQVLSDDGILIIEDVLRNEVHENIKTYYLRLNK